MAQIAEYIVLEPPTSGEVLKRSLDALISTGIMHVVLKPEFEVPREENLVIDMRIRNTRHDEEVTISGKAASEENHPGIHSILITLGQDKESPATASLVRD